MSGQNLTQWDSAVLDFLMSPGAEAPVPPTASSAQCQGMNTVPEVALPDGIVTDIQLTEEKEAIRLAQGGSLDDAIEMLTRVIAAAPEYPSALNNRAQVLRLAHREDDAKSDLDKAISICTPLTDKYSVFRNVAAQAYTQRGLLWKKAGDEERALADFERGAALGSVFAKREAVSLNPYAKLCHSMVRGLMEKYHFSHPEEGPDSKRSRT